MTYRYVVTCLLCVWMFAICAPSVFYVSMEDPGIVVSMNASEEEPGEGEKQDGMEETLALPDTPQLRLFSQAPAKKLTLKNRVNSLELVREVILPPPERNLFS